MRGRWGIIKQYRGCNWRIPRGEYRKLEDRLCRYAEINNTINEIEAKIEDEIDDGSPMRSTSIVLFDVGGGGIPDSVQEAFFTRRDISKMMNKIRALQKERTFMLAVLSKLKPKDYEFVNHEYLRHNKTMSKPCYHGYTRMGHYYRKMAILAKIQKIVKVFTKLDNG